MHVKSDAARGRRAVFAVIGTQNDPEPPRAQRITGDVGKNRALGPSPFKRGGFCRLRLNLDPGATLRMGGNRQEYRDHRSQLYQGL